MSLDDELLSSKKSCKLPVLLLSTLRSLSGAVSGVIPGNGEGGAVYRRTPEPPPLGQTLQSTSSF